MSPRALMTGATGFIGGNLATRLADDGWDVTALLRAGSDGGRVTPGARTVEHDGTAAGLRALVGDAQPDVVFHLASLFLSAHEPDDVDALIASNVQLGTQLAEACAGARVGAFVNVGTSWQSFISDGYRPVNLYAATKQAFEDILAFYVDATPLRAITLRLFDTYGPGDPRSKLLALLIEAGRGGQPLALSPGEQVLDLVHVDDVVDAIVVAAQRLLAGAVAGHEIYGISSGERLSLRALVALVEELTGAPLAVEFGARPYRKREVMAPWRPATVLPDWSPAITLREGISELLGGSAD